MLGEMPEQNVSATNSAGSIIDKAISENRFGEILIYVVSVLIVGAGIFGIIFGALTGEGLVALGGGMASSLIFPAFGAMREMRRQNMAIRLLETSLAGASTSEEASRAINDVFRGLFPTK